MIDCAGFVGERHAFNERIDGGDPLCFFKSPLLVVDRVDGSVMLQCSEDRGERIADTSLRRKVEHPEGFRLSETVVHRRSRGKNAILTFYDHVAVRGALFADDSSAEDRQQRRLRFLVGCFGIGLRFVCHQRANCGGQLVPDEVPLLAAGAETCPEPLEQFPVRIGLAR